MQRRESWSATATTPDATTSTRVHGAKGKPEMRPKALGLPVDCGTRNGVWGKVCRLLTLLRPSGRTCRKAGRSFAKRTCTARPSTEPAAFGARRRAGPLTGRRPGNIGTRTNETHGVRFAKATIFLLACVVSGALPTTESHAQTGDSTILVRNFGQTWANYISRLGGTVRNNTIAQRFTTGDAGGGYVVDGMTFRFHESFNEDDLDLRASIRQKQGNLDVPVSERLITLSKDRSSISNYAHNLFNAPANAEVLRPNTPYFMVIECINNSCGQQGNSARLDMRLTNSDREDSVGESDWTLHSGHRVRNHNDWSATTGTLIVSISGRKANRAYIVDNGVKVVSTPTAQPDTYALGDIIVFEVKFDKNVQVKAGKMPGFNFQIASGNAGKRAAQYTGGSGTRNLRFAYTVTSTDPRDRDGIWIGNWSNTWVNAAGNITDADLNDALLDHDELGLQPSHKVDPNIIRPTVTSIEIISEPLLPVTGYGVGERIKLRATFDTAVAVTGTPRLAIQIGDERLQAGYISAESSGSSIVFGYRVKETNTDHDGINIVENAMAIMGDPERGLLGADAAIVKDSGNRPHASLYSAAGGNESDHKVFGRRDALGDADLGNLSLDEATLTPAFLRNRNTYTAEVETDMDVVTVSARPSISAASIQILPPDSDDTLQGHQVPLEYGSNGITVTVLAANGTTTQEYTVTVQRPSSFPDRPEKPTVNAISATSVDLTWSAPTERGAPITGYTIRYQADGTSSWQDWPHSDTSTEATITGLTEDVLYRVQVQANSAQGTSEWSPSGAREISVPDAPGRPIVMRPSASTTSVDVSWTKPAGNGAPITGYVVQYRDADAPNWQDWEHLDATTQTTITGLTANVAQRVQVSAVNSEGMGPWSDEGLTDASAPETPAKPTVSVASATSLNVTWIAPIDNGEPITDYAIRYSEDGVSWTDWTHTGATVQTVITGLSVNMTYQVEVSAINAEGMSLWSESGEGTILVPDKPNKPIVTVASATSLDIVWTTPADSGSSIMGYAIQYREDGAPSWISWLHRNVETKTKITGLSANKTYRVQVSARNAAGTSQWSDADVKTIAVPDDPQIPTVRGASTTSVNVHWRKPSDNDSPITAYAVRYRESGTSQWLEWDHSDTTTSTQITDLVNNTQYQVEVQATNVVGTSRWSPPGQGAPGIVTGEPGELRLVDDNGPTINGEGRLEAFYRGEWGTVCDDRFNNVPFKMRGPNYSTDPTDFQMVPNVAPQLACQLMGHSTGEVVSRGELRMNVAPASQKIWLDDVRCAEGSTHWTGKTATALNHCYNAGIGLHNCSHTEDVHLRCSGSSPARAALSGEFQNVPESHDGTEFTFQTAFSEAVTASAEDLRDHAFAVTEGTVTEVSPIDGRSDLWSVTIAPTSTADVTVTLEGERACDTPGAVCAENGTLLTNTVSVDIPGTPVTEDGLTASFEEVPTQHDGETPFTLRLALSAPVRNSYTAMRENVLEATGGTVTRARRIDGRSDLWEITVTPQGDENVEVKLEAGRACGTPGALCTRDGRGLTTGLITVIPGPATIGPRSPGPAPLTARFTNIPDEHDGESTFTVEVIFSEAPAGTPSGMRNRTLRNALDVTGGAVTRVRKVNQSETHRIVTVQPAGHDAVDIVLPASEDCEAAGAICTEAGGRLEIGLLTQVRGPAALRVADAEVHEGPGAVLPFSVTLDRATSATVSVDYATSDGTAQAGSDYTAATGSVTFTPGETEKTINVAVLDDSHDEGTETMTLTLSNPSGAYLADAAATGTINNHDPMPKAWMVRFGRTVGSQVVDALGARLDGGGSSHVTVGGINVVVESGAEPVIEDDDPFGLPAWATNAEREADAQTISADDILLRSAFHLSSGTQEPGAGPAFTAWGRVATGGFEAEEDSVTMNGDVTTGLIGFDAEWERALAGVMLSQSTGEGSYRLDPAHGSDGGTVDSSLTGVYPYMRVDLNAKVSAWALAGMGSGELTLHQEGGEPMPTDISMRMGALGVNGQMLDGSGPSGIGLNVKSDAMWVGTKSERSGDMIASEGDVLRLRLILQGERSFEAGNGATFTPSAEVGLRHDGGDAETGTGVEVGAGLRYTIGSVTIEGQVRTLIAHEATGYDEWGASGAIRVTPSASGRGLTLSIAPEWGRTGSATERLWSAHDATALGAESEFEAGNNLQMDAGYGVGVPGNRGVLTPYAGMTLGNAGNRTIRTGARWQFNPDTVVSVEATRQTSDAGESANELKLRAALRF